MDVVLMRTLLATLVASAVCAFPNPLPAQDEAVKRQLSLSGLKSILQGLQQDASEVDPYPALLSSLEAIPPGISPASIEEVPLLLSRAHTVAAPTGYFEQSAALILAGLASNDVKSPLGLQNPENDDMNHNPSLPASKAVYPKKAPGDAPYSQSAEALREQIYIPADFTYGKKPPVILVPGTGERGGNTYAGNFRITLRENPNADPVLLNYPGYGLADAQQNAETVAYAINYIAALTGKNVSTLAWSQGNINVQWALKYWPSTRDVLTNSIGFSPDYHGTLVANVIHPLNPSTPLPPSLIQQEYNSNFVQTLRADGGDSAYVPTTTIYSGFFDEIVEPQQGKRASGYLLDERNVGVTNVGIPGTCGLDTAAGMFADHESVLFNSLTYAVVVDALAHNSPAKLSRINLTDACSRHAAPGLSLANVLQTESTIPFAGYQIAVFPDKVTTEPPIKAYARRQS